VLNGKSGNCSGSGWVAVFGTVRKSETRRSEWCKFQVQKMTIKRDIKANTSQFQYFNKKIIKKATKKTPKTVKNVPK
jgi:hypothetical protein